MSTPRNVAAVFQKNATRQYTYRDENTPPLEVGEKGDVETDRGTVTVEIVAVGVDTPRDAKGDEIALRIIKRFEGITPAPTEPPAPPPPAEPIPRPSRKAKPVAPDVEGIDEQ